MKRIIQIILIALILNLVACDMLMEPSGEETKYRREHNRKDI